MAAPTTLLLDPIRFDVSDVDGLRSHLDEHGYVVVREVLTSVELSTARTLLWEHLEREVGIQACRVPVQLCLGSCYV